MPGAAWKLTGVFNTEIQKSRLGPAASPAVTPPTFDSGMQPVHSPFQRLPPPASFRRSTMPAAPASMRSAPDRLAIYMPMSPAMPSKPRRMPMISRWPVLPLFW
jgi:hypothetical protein